MTYLLQVAGFDLGRVMPEARSSHELNDCEHGLHDYHDHVRGPATDYTGPYVGTPRAGTPTCASHDAINQRAATACAMQAQGPDLSTKNDRFQAEGHHRHLATHSEAHPDVGNGIHPDISSAFHPGGGKGSHLEPAGRAMAYMAPLPTSAAARHAMGPLARDPEQGEPYHRITFDSCNSCKHSTQEAHAAVQPAMLASS